MPNVNPAIPDAPVKDTDRPGYEYDPFGAKTQFDDIHPPTIPFHNYRQIHVGECAWWEGMRAESIRKIPECPPLWGDVSHYWKMVSLAGFFGYEFLTKDSLVIKVGTVIGSAGLVELIRKFVLPMIGVSL